MCLGHHLSAYGYLLMLIERCFHSQVTYHGMLVALWDIVAKLILLNVNLQNLNSNNNDKLSFSFNNASLSSTIAGKIIDRLNDSLINQNQPRNKWIDLHKHLLADHGLETGSNNDLKQEISGGHFRTLLPGLDNNDNDEKPFEQVQEIHAPKPLSWPMHPERDRLETIRNNQQQQKQQRPHLTQESSQQEPAGWRKYSTPEPQWYHNRFNSGKSNTHKPPAGKRPISDEGDERIDVDKSETFSELEVDATTVTTTTNRVTTRRPFSRRTTIARNAARTRTRTTVTSTKSMYSHEEQENVKYIVNHGAKIVFGPMANINRTGSVLLSSANKQQPLRQAPVELGCKQPCPSGYKCIINSCVRDTKCPAWQKFGPGPPKNCAESAPTDPNNLPPAPLENWFTKEVFENLFPKANIGWGPNNPCWPYNYEAFVIAARYFPKFGAEAPDNGYWPDHHYKRDLATFFAHAVQETGENDASLYETIRNVSEADDCFYRGGFFNWFEGGPISSFLDPISPGYEPEDGGQCIAAGRYCADTPDLQYFFPCSNETSGNAFYRGCYFGRGAIQISYNFNYGLFQQWLHRNNIFLDILKEPNLLMTHLNPPLAIMASLWFYMTPQPPKPSMHDLVLGQWEPGPVNRKVGFQGPAFGVTSLVINNECNGEDSTTPGGPGESRRIKAFKWFCEYFGAPVGPAEHLTCKNMPQRLDQIKQNVSWQPDWTNTWKSAPCNCAPAPYGGEIPYFQDGFYPKSFVELNEENRRHCVESIYDQPSIYNMNSNTSACLKYDPPQNNETLTTAKDEASATTKAAKITTKKNSKLTTKPASKVTTKPNSKATPTQTSHMTTKPSRHMPTTIKTTQSRQTTLKPTVTSTRKLPSSLATFTGKILKTTATIRSATTLNKLHNKAAATIKHVTTKPTELPKTTSAVQKTRSTRKPPPKLTTKLAFDDEPID